MTLTAEAQKTLDAYKLKREKIRTEQADALFMGYQSIYCLKCAGATLESEIVARPTGKRYQGFMGETVTRLTPADIEQVRKQYSEFMEIGPDTKLCECRPI